jgi:hypothetical protein
MRVLLILNSYSKPVVDDLRKQRLELKVIYYGGKLFDDVGIRHWGEWANIVIVEDGILNVLSQVFETPLWPVSRYREAILRGEIATVPSPVPTMPERSSEGPFVPPSNPVLFFASNDTHVRMFAPLARIIKNYKHAIIDPRKRQENAALALQNLGEEFEPYKKGLIERLRPSVVVFGNDWAAQERLAVHEARAHNIPTVCIQEGCLDWGDPLARRMQWCDCPFVQGPLTLKYLDRDFYFITGNPRLDPIKKLPLPEKPTVMINSNFTYGLFADWRDRWVGDVVQACRHAGLDHFISRHPRDKAEFPGVEVKPSSAAQVHDHLALSSLLVTRFSTLVYEAILMGRTVVYYNPHGEKMWTFNEDDTGGVTRVYDPGELSEAIATTIRTADNNSLNREHFLRLHCGALDNQAVERCAIALGDVANWYSANAFVRRAFASLQSSERLTRLLTPARLSRALLTRYRRGKPNRRT